MVNILGTTTKGIFGVSQAVTGMVVHSVNFNFKTEPIDFYNQEGDISSVGYLNHTMDFTLDGEYLASSTFSGTVAEVISLSSIPAHLPAGYTGGSAIKETISISEEFKSWKKVSIGGRVLPKVS